MVRDPRGYGLVLVRPYTGLHSLSRTYVQRGISGFDLLIPNLLR